MAPLPARLLLDLPNWLGDFVHTLPAALRLCAAHGTGTATLLLPSAHAPLGRLLGAQTIVRNGREGYWWARRRLAGRFDVAVTARHSTRAKLLLAGCRPVRALSSAGRGARLLGLEPFRLDRSRHQRHDLDAALERVGAQPVDDDPARLPLPDVIRRLGERRAAELADGRRPVALLPSSHAMPEKRWPAERFGTLGASLLGEGLRPLVVVGPGEGEMGAEVAARAGGRLVPVAWPLDEVAAVLAACAAAVGNDSGLTHLAAVAGSPTVALFGPTEPARTAPVGGARIVRPPEGAALAELTPSLVLAEMTEVLGRARGPRERVGAR
ncbi:MAG: glycosyltransferase family 9 protein [Acidobacteriota bacterium]